ncbi:MAG: hypothetical protein K2P81_00605 [Bacteriovoracaceae bacterium]|nr:hypothetical protein [Bacteriovoracaceae bacterium]
MARIKGVPKPVGKLGDKEVVERVRELKAVWEIIKTAKLVEQLKKDRVDYSTSTLVWQFIRLNKNYIKYYEKNRKKKLKSIANSYAWGFESLLDPSILIPARSFTIELRQVRFIDLDATAKTPERAFKTLKSLSRISQGAGVNLKPVILYFNKSLRAEELERLVSKEIKRHLVKSKALWSYKPSKVENKVLAKLVLNAKQDFNLPKESCRELYHLIQNTSNADLIAFHRLKKMADDFDSLASNSPGIFYSKSQ